MRKIQLRLGNLVPNDSLAMARAALLWPAVVLFVQKILYVRRVEPGWHVAGPCADRTPMRLRTQNGESSSIGTGSSWVREWLSSLSTFSKGV